MYIILMTAVGLAMDAFAVSVSSGICIRNFKPQYAFKFGFYFGAFQFIMTLIGYFAAFLFAKQMHSFSHWVAFVLLSVIGANMIYDTFKKDEKDCPVDFNAVMRTKNMVMMSVATSIDAMAVGVSLALFNVRILMCAFIIGVVAFLFSFAGTIIGNKIGGIFEKNAQMLGGSILIGIGIKILTEHI